MKTLVDGGVDPSRLAGVIELIPVYLEMPEWSRRFLGDYVLNVRPPDIEVSSDASGRLVLSQSRWARNSKSQERLSTKV